MVISLSNIAGCSEESQPDSNREVIIFTALDRTFSEPILNRFQEMTGITVRVKYDTEAAKTTGLINQIIARKTDPECDVLWNNEIIQTQHLANLGLLQPYHSPSANRFPKQFVHPHYLWTGFAARSRVVIYNKNLIDQNSVPRTLQQMTEEQWRGQVAMALPFFGTTFTHMSILKQKWGDEKLTQWLIAMKANGTAIAPGNASVRDMVASGERLFGLTDTDDAYGAMLDGKPVDIIWPDQKMGAVIIPNSVAIIANCKHLDDAKQLIDYLLSAEVEKQLAKSRSAQIPLGSDLVELKTPFGAQLNQIMQYDVPEIAKNKEQTVKLLRQADFDL